MQSVISPFSVSVPNTSVQLLGPNPRRHAVVISSPAAGVLTIAFANSVTLDAGIHIHPATLPLILRREYFGDAIGQPIAVISSVAGPTTVGGVEVSALP